MKKYLIFIIILFIAQGCATKKNNDLINKIDAALDNSVKQYRYLSTKVQPGEYPKSWDDKSQKLETSNSEWWCSGFYPGTLIIS